MKSREFAENWYVGAPGTEETELRISGLTTQVEKFRVETQDDIAAWFENSGMENLTPQQVAQIIRKWRPE